MSTCDLITVGAPIPAASSRAASGVVAKPWAETGIPALATTCRDSNSKKRIGPRSLGGARAARAGSYATGSESNARRARVADGCSSQSTVPASRSRSATTRASRAATWTVQPAAASWSHSRASRTSANVS